jgi:hypothetical protein
MISNQYIFHKLMLMIVLLSLVSSQSEMDQEISKFLGANNVLDTVCPYLDYDYYVLSVQYPSNIFY